MHPNAILDLNLILFLDLSFNNTAPIVKSSTYKNNINIPIKSNIKPINIK